MQAAGCRLYQDYREMAFMGIWAVLRHLGQIRRNFRIAEEALLGEKPDVLVLVDYPSFNLKMAAFCRRHLPGTKIIYYIPPKVWAWKAYRIHRIARLSDAVLGIFPFEPEVYRAKGYRCTYVGNPTASALAALQPLPDAERRGIVLLPGSRVSEISHCLPRMVEAAQRVAGNERVQIAAAPGVDKALYARLAPGVEVVEGCTHELLCQARAAIINSGTATLEASVLGCPHVAVYHIGAPAWMDRMLRPVIFRRLPFFTLPNILAGREVVRECISRDFTVDQVAEELSDLLHSAERRQAQLSAFAAIRAQLGTQDAAQTAADLIVR